MATITPLKKIFSGKVLPKRVAVNVQIVGFVTSKKLKIRDSNQGGPFYLDTNLATHFMLRYLEVGRTINIINPEVKKDESTLVIQRKTIVSNGLKIEGLESTLPYLGIYSTFDMEKDCPIPGKLLGKVVKIFASKRYDTKYGPRFKLSFAIKDIAGHKQTIDMWRKTDQVGVKLGKAYIFSNLATGEFPNDKPHFLKFVKDVSFQLAVQLASEEDQQKMANVTYADGEFSGKILAIHSTVVFRSCNHCKCSVQEAAFKVGDKCPKCQKLVTEVFDNYSFTMVVENGASDECSMTGFCGHLPVDKQATPDLLEVDLCKEYVGKSVSGSYIQKRFKEEGDKEIKLIVESIEIPSRG